MEPNNFDNPDQPVNTTEKPATPSQQTETYASAPQVEQPIRPPVIPKQQSQPQMTAQSPKKSQKKLYIIFGLTIAIIIVAVVGYFVYGYYNHMAKTTDTDTKKIVTPVTTVTNKDNNPTVDAASATLTGGVTSESTITNTDESNIASDASNAAGNVGDSVNENNF